VVFNYSDNSSYVELKGMIITCKSMNSNKINHSTITSYFSCFFTVCLVLIVMEAILHILITLNFAPGTNQYWLMRVKVLALGNNVGLDWFSNFHLTSMQRLRVRRTDHTTLLCCRTQNVQSASYTDRCFFTVKLTSYLTLM